jgi:citrate lyase subunit beta/citryl-CoA lyase
MAETPALTFSDVRLARSMLFVPGHLAGRFAKASASGADAVICDLEDAVPPELKDLARRHVANWLTGSGAACVRINALNDPAHVADLAALRGLSDLRGVLVPKAEDPAGLEEVHAGLGGDVPVIALIETALGVHRAHELAGAPGVERLAFGSIDFALDAGMAEDDQSMLFARSTLVIASRAHRISAPLDGVTTDLSAGDVAGAAARRAKALGFGGKLCIHPSQIAPVNDGFSPSKEDLAWAKKVVDQADESGVSSVDGHMVDKPVMERARAILASGATRGADGGR